MKYSIQGDTLPVVVCELDAGEKIITEGGGMAWMSPNMKMETTGGGIGKMFGRALSGDTLFQNIYTAERTNGMISIASSFPGSIKAFEITPGNEIILQKSAFLASEAGVELSMHFRKNLAQVFSVVKALFYRSFQVMVLLLQNLMAMSLNTNYSLVSRL